jgi:hypothetical protein
VHSAAEFNISPGRWQHVWLLAIAPTERGGKMDRNDCHTAWGNFKILISSLSHYRNYACSFSLIGFLKIVIVVILSVLLSIAIYRLHLTTFLTQAGVAIDLSHQNNYFECKIKFISMTFVYSSKCRSSIKATFCPKKNKMLITDL